MSIIHSNLILSNYEASKNDETMPSLISSNCEMSSKCIDETLEEGSRALQHYCITLGVGPLWWSWCAPCRIVCIYSQHREPRRGDQAESALCELPHCARGWIIESIENKWVTTSDLQSPTDREYISGMGNSSMARYTLHPCTKLPITGRFKRRLRLTFGIRRRNATLHQHRSLLA